MGRDSIEAASRPDAIDAGQAIVRAAVASVPVIGSAAAELMGFVVTPPLEARRNEWLNSLALDLDRLQSQLDDFKIPGLSLNDNFLSAVAVAVGVATRSAERDKRDMLRNAVLNSALGDVPDFDMQAVFIGYLEYLMPLHVQLLRIFLDPKAALTAIGSDLERRYIGGSPSLVVEELLPQLKDRRDVYDFLWQDLYQRRLVNTDSLHGSMTSSGMVASRVSEVGRQFLAYISKPSVVTGVEPLA
ncbi:MAG: hypothetical protein ACYDHQ_04660 [Coriobacteriia bacterium]